MRQSWPAYFMNMAYAVRQQSSCLRRHVGAVIVLDKQIISTGYNGMPSGIPHCTAYTGGPLDCIRTAMNVPSGERPDLCFASHAETNAIAQAAKYGISVYKTTMYCTNKPCGGCLKIIINSGISKVVFCEPYTDQIAKILEPHAPLTLLPIVELDPAYKMPVT